MILRSEPSLGTFEPVVALNNPVGVGATLVAHQPKQNLHQRGAQLIGAPFGDPTVLFTLSRVLHPWSQPSPVTKMLDQ